MIGLDTNVLVRFFAQDDVVLSSKADVVMESLTESEPGWVGVATILDLAWEMRTEIRVDRAGIACVLAKLLSRREIVVERADIVEIALRLYRVSKAEFADCLIASSGKAAGCSRALTFDRKAARDTGMQLIV